MVLIIKVCGCYSGCFCVLQLLPIRLTQQNLCCISTYMMKHRQILDRKLDLPWCSCGCRKRMFVALHFIECIGIVNKTWRRGPIFVWTCLFMEFVLWSLPNQTSIKYRGPIEKSKWITYAHLRWYQIYECGFKITTNMSILGNCHTSLEENCKSITIVDFARFQWRRSMTHNSYACSECIICKDHESLGLKPKTWRGY